MNKKDLLKRLLASPFILGILFIGAVYICIGRFILYLKYGGEWIIFEKKDDVESVYKIYQLLKKQNQ